MFRYTQGVTMFTEEMPWFSPDDLEWIMGRAIHEGLGWDRAATIEQEET